MDYLYPLILLAILIMMLVVTIMMRPATPAVGDDPLIDEPDVGVTQPGDGPQGSD